jgi:2-keto-4-pentenoate hydratase/2-oxohepta-3-ene-1,7-dioic acid hydratase in catechol pathway
VRIARVAGPCGPAFAVQAGDGSWIDVATLGIEAATTADLIAAEDILRAANPSSLAGGIADPRFLAPIVGPVKLMATGPNYRDHMKETRLSPPPNPILFTKYPSAVVGPTDDIIADPDMTSQADYEGELAVIIGKRVKGISESEALDAVFGYTVSNDVTARDAMRINDWKIDGQLDRAKNFDTFCPVGPWITTADEVPDPQSLWIKTTVNGQVRQDSSTSLMYFSTAYMIHDLARGMTLEPGDVLLTGTPHGVGFVMDPPVFLKPGDLVEVEVEGLGKLANRVASPPPPTAGGRG